MSITNDYSNIPEAVLSPTAPSLDPAIEGALLRVRLHARRRIAWLRKIWTDTGAYNGHNVHTEVDGYLHNADTPIAEWHWYAQADEVQEINEALATTMEKLKKDETSRLALLIRIFHLNDLETAVLHLCLAITVDPNLGRVFAYLNDHSGRAYATEELAARLFGYGRSQGLGATSPLLVWGLIVEHKNAYGEPARLECDPYLKNWLLGRNDLDTPLNYFAQKQPFRDPPSNWPVDETAGAIARLLDQARPPRIRVLVAGAEGSGRRTFCAGVAASLGLPLLSLDSDRIPETEWSNIFMRAQRYAYLQRSALLWYGAAVRERPWLRHIPAFQLQFLTSEVDEYLSPTEGFLDLRIDLPDLDSEQRRQLWLKLLPAAAQWPEAALDHLARRRQTTIGQIAAVAAYQVDSPEAAVEAIGLTERRRLGALAQRLTSDFQWDDLVISDWLRDSLEDFTFEARERTAIWEQPAARRLFPQGKGLLALFTGPPGTGKTMSAQVMANVLQLDLYRVDLSTIVSKYVGETSKNIERILSRAQRMDAILLFDEADALFGKRTDIKDAHDRFANTDTNYLLQAIEQFPGIAILASNRKTNIDAGFTRRLRYVMDFPKPDAGQRRQLWRRIAEELTGMERAAALDKDLIQLADLMELTGAQIKYALLSAVYMARREETSLGPSHLLRGLERELQKEGLGLNRQAQQILKRTI